MLWPGTKPVSKVTLYILDVPGRRLSGWNLSGTFYGLIEEISEVVYPKAVGISKVQTLHPRLTLVIFWNLLALKCSLENWGCRKLRSFMKQGQNLDLFQIINILKNQV